MNSITVETPTGDTQVHAFTPGDNLMELLRDAGYDEIEAICGGGCACATCHVHIADQAQFDLPEKEENEVLLLELADHFDEAESRLSCQIKLSESHNGMRVQLLAGI